MTTATHYNDATVNFQTFRGTSRKQVTDLRQGDVIDPPAGEKVWLWRDGIKRRYTVVSVSRGHVTKKGQFWTVTATCPSPYKDEDFSIRCDMLEGKIVTVR
jgi:hypothetical protein